MNQTQKLPPHVVLLLDRLAPARLTKVVDVGANPQNRPAYADLRDAGQCEVIGFEPMPFAYAQLLETKLSNETYFPHAVGDGSRQELKIYTRKGFTSVLDPYPAGERYVGGTEWRAVVERISFETVTLDGTEGLGQFDLLKIDIQGGEVAVFKGGRQALAKATAIIVELRYYRLYEQEPMLGGVDEELRAQGFYLHKFLDFSRRMAPHSQAHRVNRVAMRDQLLDGDAVYLRDLGRIDELSDEQLCHLCILAASVFASHSIVLHCLDALVLRGAVAADLPGVYVDTLPRTLRHGGGGDNDLARRRAQRQARRTGIPVTSLAGE